MLISAANGAVFSSGLPDIEQDADDSLIMAPMQFAADASLKASANAVAPPVANVSVDVRASVAGNCKFMPGMVIPMIGIIDEGISPATEMELAVDEDEEDSASTSNIIIAKTSRTAGKIRLVFIYRPPSIGF